MNTATGTTTSQEPSGKTASRRFGWGQLSVIVLAVIVITIGVTFWVVTTYVFPSEFTPISLSSKEEEQLNAKLEQLNSLAAIPQDSTTQGAAPLESTLTPEKYSEAGAERDISFSERELNALLAKNTDLAKKLAVDLSDNLVSAKLLVPMDPDFPVLGGRILKVKGGLEVAYQNDKPIVILKGVSVMGVPIPNDWLSGIKNVDLVKEFGTEAGFWKSFADGVQDTNVEEGSLKIQLKE